MSTIALLALLACGIQGGPSAQRAVDYQRDVRPILSSHCFACHGFDAGARKAGLRLDRRESAYAEREGIVAVKPGDLAGSELFRRISSEDPEVLMPPPRARAPLTAEQKNILRRWIEQGAAYAEHWSFVPPVLPVVPPDAGHPIDAFVRAHLRSEGLSPAPEADRATLARRVTLDLTGLPPSGAEVEAFVVDHGADAYERLVDRLLSSPHYGERMALPWLDAARYADTNGFSIDGGRHQWLWRDWVIHAFASNKPFDRFLVEQLAGDLLPDRDDGTLTATGFQRNSMITHEGGTIAEENLVNYNVDRVRTFGEAVLGLTLGCAQCHDHKYDPISQRDFYRLFAFFDQTSEPAHGGDGGVNAPPTAQVRSVLSTGEEPELRTRIAALEAQLAAVDERALADWESSQRAALAQRGIDLELHPVRLLKISTPNRGSGFAIEDERFAVVAHPMSLLAFDISIELPPLSAPITGLRVVMHTPPGHPEEGWGFGGKAGKRSFALTSLSVSGGPVPGDQVNLYQLLPMRRVTASGWDGENRPEGVLGTSSANAWIPDPAADGPVHLTASFAAPLDPERTRFLTAQLNFGRFGDMTARRMEFFVVTGEDDDSELPREMQDALTTTPETRTEQQRAAIRREFVEHAPATARVRTALAHARERLAVRTEAWPTMVMDTRADPRKTFVLHRGVYSNPGEEVSAGTPAALPPMPDGAPANRLGLAQWVVADGNPLTARVAVNRIWQVFFGVGLVKTAADFGMQGEAPSNQALLDWLAVDFRTHGWDVKRLVRQIVTSGTYRAASRTTPRDIERDPDNRLLARGPRFRLPAELIRDQALAISGLLVPSLGGPSVNPYTPGDPWREISHYGSTPATAQSFVQDHGDKLYRRSLYTYWKRTLPPPDMATFDAPNRETCVVDRAVTNTPLQALVLLNDVQFVEAARAFAERILHQAGDDHARLSWAFAEVTGRRPDRDEAAVLEHALLRERGVFDSDPDAATRLLAQGESPRDATLDRCEHAAWTQLAALLLNLSETVTRN
ncbi:MAG: PSD1 and planctomycete cytochrome C domain-containing protein [Planctomycetota bacterium]